VPEIVSSRLCESTWLTVEDFGTYAFDENGGCPSGISMFLSPDGMQWTVGATNLTSATGDFGQVTLEGSAAPFSLHTNYAFPEHGLSVFITDGDLRDAQCRSVNPRDGDFTFKGTANGGFYSFTRCSIAERTSDGQPKYLRVDVDYSGSIFGAVTTFYPSDPALPFVIDELATSFSGLIKDVRVTTADPLGTFSPAVEEACLAQSSDLDSF